MLNTRGVAFITYSNESNAQFAKEAMAHQSLDHTEILNVRWATADPNPMSQAREARRIEEQAAEAVRRALPAAFVAEIEGRDPEARKRKKIDGGFGLEGYDAPDKVYFARGANAVNPVGRIGYDVDEKQKLIENGNAIGDEAHGDQQQQEVQTPQATGIFSNSTIAALQNSKANSQSQQQSKAAGPLVAYDSDSD